MYTHSIDPVRMKTLAHQVVQLLPAETECRWYSASTYDENRKPKSAKGILQEKYNTLRNEAWEKLKRNTKKKDTISTTTVTSYSN